MDEQVGFVFLGPQFGRVGMRNCFVTSTIVNFDLLY